MHALIAMTCLNLSVKIYESCILDFEQGIQLCQRDFGFEYQTEMFLQAEFQIFKQLDFDLMMPTAFDFLL